ncbi:MAG: hypothetical protein IK042_00010 [Bacteroidales bacterium]|nr:hypothetical protein [Bacteroidales bacterium]
MPSRSMKAESSPLSANSLGVPTNMHVATIEGLGQIPEIQSYYLSR